MIDKSPILIVDDEPGILNVLAIQLKHEGFAPITTTSGEEAIGMVRDKKPDVVLLDILMPGMTGLEVLEKIREFSQVPVIVFTANPRVVDEALKMGASGFIAKPFKPETLVPEIKSIMGKCAG